MVVDLLLSISVIVVTTSAKSIRLCFVKLILKAIHCSTNSLLIASYTIQTLYTIQTPWLYNTNPLVRQTLDRVTPRVGALGPKINHVCLRHVTSIRFG